MVVRKREVAELKLLASQADAVAWLERNLKVQILEDGTLKVSLSGQRARDQALIINAVVKRYLLFMDKRRRKLRNNRPQRVQGLEKRAAGYKERLPRLQKSIREYRARLKTETDPQIIATWTTSIQQAQKKIAEFKECIKKINTEIQEVRTESDVPAVTLLKKAAVPKESKRRPDPK